MGEWAVASLRGEYRSEGEFLLEPYDRDLRHLINADFADEPLIPQDPMHGGLSVPDLVRRSAESVPIPWSPDELFVERIPWSVLNHGLALMDLLHRWPDRDEAHALFWQTVAGKAVHWGVPPALGIPLRALLERRPQDSAWFYDTAESVGELVSTVRFPGRDLPELVAAHLQLRAAVATRVREAEITHPLVVAAAELLGTVRFLRAGAAADVQRAWRSGGCDPNEASKVFREHDLRGELFAESALLAALHQPPADAVAELTSCRREALGFARAMRARNPTLDRGGFLEAVSRMAESTPPHP